jgi:hypothetical protein
MLLCARQVLKAHDKLWPRPMYPYPLFAFDFDPFSYSRKRRVAGVHSICLFDIIPFLLLFIFSLHRISLALSEWSFARHDTF